MQKFKQHDERDCGAACFATILSAYNSKITLQSAREMVKCGINGTSIYNLVIAARHINMESDAYEGSFEDLLTGVYDNDIPLPCIAHIATDEFSEHYIVILRVSYKSVKVFDPARGVKTYSAFEFCNIWSGHIVTLVPSKSYKPIFQERDNSLYKKLVKKNIPSYVLVAVFSVLCVIISLAGTLGYSIVVDGFLSEADCNEEHGGIEHFLLFDHFKIVVLVLLGLYVFQTILRFIRDMITSTMAKKANKYIASSFIGEIFNIPMDRFNFMSSGEYISRFSDIQNACPLFSQYFLVILFDCIVFIGGSILMCIISPVLFLLVTIIAIFYTLLIGGFSHFISRANTNFMSKNAFMVSDFKELIDGINTIKACKGDTYFKDRLSNNITSVAHADYKRNIIGSLQNSIAVSLESLCSLLTLYIGYLFVQKGTLSLGNLMTFSMLIGYMLSPINSLIELQPNIQSSFTALSRLDDVFYTAANIYQNNYVECNNSLLNISFKNVCFSYEDDQPVLTNITETIHKGEKILLSGKNGCGKSTFIKLLLAMYKPQKGTISIASKDINTISQSSLMNMISYVPQDIFIFSASIRENITIGCNEISDEKLLEIINEVDLTDFINSLPQGADSYLFENGKNLSGGQKQKIALARALIREPSVLILDETTSQMEERSRKDILMKIFDKRKDMTCIIVSHDTCIRDICDREIVISR